MLWLQLLLKGKKVNSCKPNGCSWYWIDLELYGRSVNSYSSMNNIYANSVALKLQETNCFPGIQVLYGERTDFQKLSIDII